VLRSLLIANRGEIARRIMRTARRLGIRTIAVHSDVDADMPFVREADEVFCIGSAPARESYLLSSHILEAASATGAEAIHPGYGFLSENAEFAEAVLDAGLVWVGAPPAAIRAMGLKDAAKQRMIKAGVAVTPGYMGEDQSFERLKQEADKIGYPVLVKAIAGGGGKGMRRVDAAQQFSEALESCRREAVAAFGDDRVLIEKYILNPRHIEVQIFGDTYGNVVHLFERDCSLQRRHQKVIEEAPAPGMDDVTRTAICEAAVKAARAVDYVGAGTIEFIADTSEGLRADRIWFMEMNTRLQVEHPVTEMITGQDLVEWQLRVASGEPVPMQQEMLAINGRAVEARLYAENPVTGFMPSTGRLDRLRYPAGVRIDSGVEEGDEITPFYDPMIAKLIAHAPTRREAASTLAQACREVQIWPVRTNAAFLARALGHPDFIAGDIDTGFIERHLDVLLAPADPPPEEVLQAAANALVPRNENDPWSSLAGFRTNSDPWRQIEIEIAGENHTEKYVPDLFSNAKVVVVKGQNVAFHNGEAWPFGMRRARPDNGDASRGGAILSPMPGKIIAVEISEGQAVTAGQKLVVLEAMKMEQSLIAPFDGTVTLLKALPGTQVQEGALLAQLEPLEK